MSTLRALTTCTLLAVCAGPLLHGLPAHAEDTPQAGPQSAADIVVLLKDKNAKYKQDKIMAAIVESTFPWSANDVFLILDNGASPDMTAEAARKAKMFWDGSAKPLPKIYEDGRAGAAGDTVNISSNGDLVIVFETFNDLKYEGEALAKQVGTLEPRKDYEDDTKWGVRQRWHAVKLAETMAPFEGKVSKLTFQIELTGGFTPHDGSCTRAQVNVDLSAVNFNLFRYTMGGLSVDVPIVFSGVTNVEKAHWMAIAPYRFEATSKPICISASQASALANQGAKLKMTIRRPHDSDKWTGEGTFVNATTNKPL